MKGVQGEEHGQAAGGGHSQLTVTFKELLCWLWFPSWTSHWYVPESPRLVVMKVRFLPLAYRCMCVPSTRGRLWKNQRMVVTLVLQCNVNVPLFSMTMFWLALSVGLTRSSVTGEREDGNVGRNVEADLAQPQRDPKSCR